MKDFDEKIFQKFTFSESDVVQFYESSLRDLTIARHDNYDEVRFSYSYQALLKGCLALTAKAGLKVRSVPGHHIRLLEKASELLNNSDVYSVGNAMRMKRNSDLYAGGITISSKEADEYSEFVSIIIDSIREHLGIDY